MTATIMGSLAAPSSPIASSAAMALSTFIFNNSAAAAGTDPQVAVAASELPTAHSEPNLKRHVLDCFLRLIAITDRESFFFFLTSRPKRNRVASPPAGYACTCGATTPGKAPARWRKGELPQQKAHFGRSSSKPPLQALMVNFCVTRADCNWPRRPRGARERKMASIQVPNGPQREPRKQTEMRELRKKMRMRKKRIVLGSAATHVASGY